MKATNIYYIQTYHLMKQTVARSGSNLFNDVRVTLIKFDSAFKSERNNSRSLLKNKQAKTRDHPVCGVF